MKSSCKGLEVFDFKEEDGIPEFAAAVYSSKLKASNAIDKYTFLENVAQGTNIPSKEIGNILCVDVDAINSDHNGENGVPFASLDEGDACDVKRMSRLDSVAGIDSTNFEQLPQFTPTEIEPRNLFCGVESSSSPAVALPSDNKLNFALSESPSNNPEILVNLCSFKLERTQDSTDVVSNADESMSERSPSTSSYVAEDDVPYGTSPDHCFDGWEMGDGNMTVVFHPDYIVYRDRYCTDAVLTFSSSCIEIKGSNAYEDQGTFVFQWGLDDIINIESQWCQRIEMAMVKIRVISKDAVQDEDVHGTSGIEELKFAVVDPDWHTKQEVITSSEMYKALWNIMLDNDMQRKGEALIGENGTSCSKHYFPVFDEHFEDVIYPKGDSDAVSISKRDVDLLQPDTFVNDTIIDFYMKYLKNIYQLDERHRFHFFNSFFFRKLADLDKDPSSVFDARAAFQRVRKWTRKVNLFEKEYIFVPVNFNYHWSLLVICHPGEVARFQDEDAEKSIKVPCILHMDSIRGSHSGLKSLLQSYLWEEWKERHKEASEDISLRFLNLRFVSLELPQQQNSFDCGLFLLHYAELFLEEAPLNFNPFKITKLSKFLTADWFQPAEASLKRVLIQRLIYGLLDNCSPENSPDIGHQKHQTSNCHKANNDNEMGIEFLSERCSGSKGSDGNVVMSAQADQGIELNLLPASSSLKSAHQCTSSGDSSLVLRELFEPEAAVGSLLDNAAYQAFNQTFNQTTPFDEFKSAVSPIEEEEAEEHFVHSPPLETGFHQLSGVPPESHSFPHTSQDFRADPSWNPGISIHHPNQDDNINSSPQASVHGSHDSPEIEVNENGQQPEKDLNSDEKTEEGGPTLMENAFFDSGSHCPVQTGDDNDDKEYTLKSLPENLPGLCFQVSDLQKNASDGDGDGDGEGEESVLEPEVGRPVKKMRITPTPEEGEGGLSRSLSKDLHL